MVCPLCRHYSLDDQLIKELEEYYEKHFLSAIILPVRSVWLICNECSHKFPAYEGRWNYCHKCHHWNTMVESGSVPSDNEIETYIEQYSLDERKSISGLFRKKVIA